MKFESKDGRLGQYSVGMNVGAESPSLSLLAAPPTRHLGKQCWVQRFQLAGGGTVIITEAGIVDAVGVVPPYSDSVLGESRLGDLVSDLFVGRSDTPIFPATFVEYVEHLLYFTTQGGLGISIHTEGIPSEDGPWNDTQWRTILAGRVSGVFVSRHDDRQLAY